MADFMIPYQYFWRDGCGKLSFLCSLPPILRYYSRLCFEVSVTEIKQDGKSAIRIGVHIVSTYVLCTLAS
jgi:hypothetical protein